MIYVLFYTWRAIGNIITDNSYVKAMAIDNAIIAILLLLSCICQCKSYADGSRAHRPQDLFINLSAMDFYYSKIFFESLIFLSNFTADFIRNTWENNGIKKDLGSLEDPA